ncbi:ATP-binding protein [bacterium]|nr:ATP-binding protein [bacterium]
MKHSISQIVLDEQFASYKFDHQENAIRDLSQLNIFIGPNNSGKSRFIRLLFKTEKLNFVPTAIPLNEVNLLVDEFKKELQKKIDSLGIIDYEKIIENAKQIQSIQFAKEGEEFLKPSVDLISKAASINDNGTTTIVIGRTTNTKQTASSLRPIGKKYKDQIDNLIDDPKLKFDFHKLYIPSLRGLRKLIEQDSYKIRTDIDYFKNEKLDIFTGLSLYDKIESLKRGGPDEREIIRDFESFLSENFFEKQRIELTATKGSDVVSVQIGNEKEQPIYNLGDGIQSIIIMTFPLFLNQDKNLLLFIEEPELFLHPGMQRKLVETFLNKKFSRFQYFVATHSNHFLDLTLDYDDVSIFSVRKANGNKTDKQVTPTFFIENQSNPNIKLLDQIGVKNSSVFLSNCTIWVEGITDRLYLRHCFNLYQDSSERKKYREDIHYSFVEYSGSNIAHWSFLDDIQDDDLINAKKICNRLFVIADKDGLKKLERHESLKKALGDNFYPLNCQEIENSIKKEVLLRIVAEYEGVADVTDLSLTTDFTEFDYQDVYLGEFIDKLLSDKKRKGSYKEQSGTITDKLNFCRKAIKHTNSIDDLSSEIIGLCEKLEQFIAKNN